MAATTVTLPTGELFTVTTPGGLIVSWTETGLELVVPSTKVTLAADTLSSATTPRVATDSAQGLTVTVLLAAKSWFAGKVESLPMVKRHEP